MPERRTHFYSSARYRFTITAIPVLVLVGTVASASVAPPDAMPVGARIALLAVPLGFVAVLWTRLRFAYDRRPALVVSDAGVAVRHRPLVPWSSIETLELRYASPTPRRIEEIELRVLPVPTGPRTLVEHLRDAAFPPNRLDLARLDDPDGAIAALATYAPPELLGRSTIDRAKRTEPLFTARN